MTAVRDKIEVQTVAYEMKEDQIGYIAVSEFDSVTYHQFETALEDLEKQGMKGLVIDLRNNPGGNFDTVTDMLNDPFSISRHTDDLSDAVILHSSAENLRRAGAVLIYKYGKRLIINLKRRWKILKSRE